jgi:hypothetical protein
MCHKRRLRASGLGAEPAPNPTEPVDLGSFLSATSWLGRTLETPEPLLGEVITNTTRMFLGGPSDRAS